MRPRKPVGFALGLASVALVVMAIGAPMASATQVTANAAEVEITQSQQAPGFVSANAYAEQSIQCKEASGTFTVPSATTPPANNTNRPGVGTHSLTSGSVTMAFNSPPTFTNCEVYQWVAPPVEWVATGVKAIVNTTGGWTLSATQNEEGNELGGSLAIAVPPNGASIKVESEPACTITVSPGEASSVDSEYSNAAATAVVDGQLDASSPESCGGPSPAQFEAHYTANNGFKITY